MPKPSKGVKSGRTSAVVPSVQQPINQSAGAVVERGKSYSKRKIVSNWQKYEEEGGEVEGGGVERVPTYSEVMGRNVGDGYRFKLKSEGSWEDAVAVAAGPPGGSADNLLHIDLDDMALALRCIPLHERIPALESRIPPQLKSKYDEECREYERLYKDYLDRKTVDTSSNTMSSDGLLATTQPSSTTSTTVTASTTTTTLSNATTSSNATVSSNPTLTNTTTSINATTSSSAITLSNATASTNATISSDKVVTPATSRAHELVSDDKNEGDQIISSTCSELDEFMEDLMVGEQQSNTSTPSSSLQQSGSNDPVVTRVTAAGDNDDWLDELLAL